MKKLSETYKELGIDFTFPIHITDSNGYETYYEDSKGYWRKYERDVNGHVTYFENSNGYWKKNGYDANGQQTYSDNSNGYWQKWEYDTNGHQTYFEDSNGVKQGTPRSAKTCEGKVVEVDGIKYKLTAL